MKFNKHGSFYLRSSWPIKGLKAIKEDPTIFSPQNEELAVDTLGIGRVMVSSLRYWLSVIGLAEETKDTKGLVKLDTTELGNIIYKYDPYFHRLGTAWLLHRCLSKNEENATTWYWFFNEFHKKDFTKEDFLEELLIYVRVNNGKINESTANRDFNCFKNSYISEKFENISEYIEEGIVSFFSKLPLLKTNDKSFIKLNPPIDSIPHEIIYYAILEDIGMEANQISIEQIFEEKGSVGRVFNLTYNNLLQSLKKLENLRYINLFNRFGHHHIELKEKKKYSVLEHYYRRDT